MLKLKKQDSINQIRKIYEDFNSIVIINYYGVSVQEISSLRKELYKSNSELKVVKNSLYKIAISNLEINSLMSVSGPVMVAYSNEQVTLIKSVVNFIKSNQKFKLICGVIDNQVISRDGIIKFADLPSIDEIRYRLIRILEASQIKVIRLLKASPTKFVKTLNEYIKG